MNRLFVRIVLAFAVLFPSLATAQQPTVVLSASATSSASGSSPITCLLDPACNGYWSPGSLDSGFDEGVFIQFEKPVKTDTIQVSFADTAGLDALDIQLSVDGKLANDKGWNKSRTSKNLFEFRGGGPVRSVFVKLIPQVNGAQGVQPFQMTKIAFANVAMTLPKLVPAQAKATSVLDPTTAYDPANLFDSRTDFAWATDGKKTTGKGESLTLSLSAKQNLSGIIVWNGYQRSDTHFKANGRVTQLEVKSEDGQTQSLTLQDVMGPQKLSFSKPLQNVGQLTFTLKDIKPGEKYKDVLLSELRLVDDKGAIVLPVVALPKAVAPTNWQPLIDRSFSSFLYEPKAGEYDMFYNRIRLRSNGTFVIYKGQLEHAHDRKLVRVSPDVLEGNWEPKGDKIRIFGKKYPTTLQGAEYLQVSEKVIPAAIFQSELTLRPYSSMTPQEKEQAFALLWRERGGGDPKTLGSRNWFWPNALMQEPAKGPASFPELIKLLDEKIKAEGVSFISSSVFTDLVLPTDKFSSQ